MVTRQVFHDELEKLHQRLLEMGALVEEAVHTSVRSLAEQDTAAAQAVIDGDDVLDGMELEIEEGCIHLIALQQPMAKDLRLIAAILKIITDLERIADNATNIAEITIRIADQKLIKPLEDIPRMADMSAQMVHDALDALVKQDEAFAREVADRDDAVDAIYSALFDELVEIMQADQDPVRIAQCSNLLFAARFLERIADHATNIAERVVYLASGKREKLG